MKKALPNKLQETADYLALNYSGADVQTMRDVLLGITESHPDWKTLTLGQIFQIAFETVEQIDAAEEHFAE